MSYHAQTISAALRASARLFPDKTCLCSDSKALTYSETEQAIDRLVAQLKSVGISAGDRIALLDTDSVDYLLAMYALATMGAIAVPLNYRQRAPELQYQLSHSGTRLLLAGRRYAEIARELSPALDLGWQPLDQFVSESGKLDPRAVPRALESDCSADQAFAICYTSGTTGRPKGAVQSHRSAYLRGLKFIAEFGLVESDVFHITSPMFHISSINLTFTGILRGATIAINAQFDLGRTPDFVRERNVTFMLVVPTILAMMTERADFGPDYFGKVRLIMYTAAPMNAPLLRRIMEVYRGDFVQSFGQTEDLPQAILSAADHRLAFERETPRLASVGRAAVGVELKVCDDDGNEVEAGAIGEIVTRGGTEMTGYLDNPTETEHTLRDGWIYSGDLGYQDDEGYVFLAGRKKHLIIRGGENIYPVEVERVLLEFLGVQDAAVIGLPDDKWGEIVVAVIVATAQAVDIDQLQMYLRAALAGYKCPERIVVMDALPYNAAGKVNRAELQAHFTRRPEAEKSRAAAERGQG
ncbi:MAG TPA: AMP-binding protein [Reyranella sp.]|jgi:acyl-CoA synthetase (AMP-forming)/AMP-acid ligase II